MDWNKYINERAITVEEAVPLIKSGDRLISGTGGGTPEPIYEALVKRAHELQMVFKYCSKAAVQDYADACAGHHPACGNEPYCDG